jgi:hypothetical protein
MKKLMLILSTLLITFFINSPINVAGNNNECMIKMIKDIEKKQKELQREVYLKKLVQDIEIESGIPIPNYVDVKYIEYIYTLAKELSLPTRMVFRLVHSESSFIDTIKSSAGAHGFFQVMPGTRKLYEKRFNISSLNLDYNSENIYIGTHLLKDLYDYWFDRGNSNSYSWRLALACYNTGILRVIDNNGVPPDENVINYIDFILQKPSDNYTSNK